MNRSVSSVSSLSVFTRVSALVLVLIFAGVATPALRAQEDASSAAAATAQEHELFDRQMQDLWSKGLAVSVVDDSSHRSVVYSNPGTEAEAIRKGTHEQWLKQVNDPGYLMQQLKRRLPAAGPEGFYWLGRLQQELAKQSGNAANVTLPAYGPKSMPRPAATPVSPAWNPANTSLGAAGVAPAQFVATFTANADAPSCPADYAVFAVNTPGTSGQAMIVGFNNLYPWCPTVVGTRPTIPTVRFAYYYGASSGTVKTSPSISVDGKKVTFVESKTGASVLHILTLDPTLNSGSVSGNGTVTAPKIPASGNSARDTAITLSGGVSVTRSSPFYDFNTDTIYVGDDSGYVHQISPAFCPGGGTCSPVENTTGWPVLASSYSTHMLTGPVYDAVSEQVFVGDATGIGYYIRTTAASAGTCASGAPPCVSGAQFPLGTGGTYGGMVDPPLVDIFAGMTWWSTGAGAGGGIPCSSTTPVIGQSNNLFVVEAYECLGVGAVNNLHQGAFDNAYFANPGSGHLLWAGNDASAGVPAIWSLPVNASHVITGATELGPISSSAVDASPLTELPIAATGTDWLSFSVPANSCGGTGSAGGCLATYSLTPGVSPASELPWLPSWGHYVAGSEIIDTNGHIQKASGSGTPIGPTGAATPAFSIAGGTVSDGTSVDATGTGTFSTNTAAGGQTVAVNGVTLTAATPTSAMGTGTFTADPSPTTGAVKITNAAATASQTFTPSSATAASATGTFTTDPTTGSVTITQPVASSACAAPPCAMTLAVSPGTVATGTGTFTGAPSSGIVTITNGANVMTLNASAGVAASGTGTFTLPDPLSGNVSITNGANVETLTVSPSTAASTTGTFTTEPASGSTVTITNPVGPHSQTITASLATKATATGTFTGLPNTGEAVTIDNTNTGNTLTLSAGAYTPATATLTYTAAPANNSTITIAGTTYTFVSALTAGTNNQILRASTINCSVASQAPNLAAAIMGNNALCDCEAAGRCVNAVQTANPNVTAVENGNNNVVTVTAKTSGTAGNFVFGTANAAITQSAVTSGTNPTNGCTSSTTGTFIGNGSANSPNTNVGAATNFAAAINACDTSYPTIGVTATSLSNVVTVSAGAGTAGNNITLSSTTPGVAATGTVNAGTGWVPNAGQTITVGATTYTWETALTAVNQLLISNASEGAIASNFQAVVNNNSAQCYTAGCVHAGQTANASVSGAGSSGGTGSVVTLTALTAGGVGNNIALSQQEIPFILTPANGFLAGGTGGTMANFSWSGSALTGGTGSPTSATIYAIDGVPADDAMQLAAAINLNTSGNLPFTATSSSNVVTVTDSAVPRGTGQNGVLQVSTNAAGGTFAWASPTLGGAVNGTTSATMFATDGVLLDDATQLATAINTAPNPANVGVTATCAGYPICTSQPVTVSASAIGLQGNSIALAKTATDFTWSGSTLTGGSGFNTGVYFATISGNTTTNAANLAAAITRNTSASVPVTAANGGTNIVTVTSTIRGTAANNIVLATNTTTSASGYFTFTANPTTDVFTNCDNGTILVGNIPYAFLLPANWPSYNGTCSGAGAPFTGGEVNVLLGTTAAQTAQNLAVAINNSGTCGYNPGTGNGNCYYDETYGANTFVTASATGSTVVLTAKGVGAAGNCASTAQQYATAGCWSTEGWSNVSAVGTTYIPIGPASSGGNFGIVNGGITGSVANLAGFAWNSTDPVNLAGGTNGTTSASMFATDGVLADDATNLATAVGLGNTANTVGVTATSSGVVVTLAGNPRGTVGNNITLASTGLTGDFAWSAGTMSGGAAGTTNATTYAIDGVANDNAIQLAAAINTAPNPANLGLGATATGAGVVKLTETLPGTTGNTVALSEVVPLTATSSFSFTAQPESWYSAADFPGIYVGGVLWNFDCASGSTGSAPCNSTDYYNDYTADAAKVILIGDTLAHTVQNVVAAINNAGQAACGYTDPTVGDGALYHTCYSPATAQAFVSATGASPTVTLTSKVTGTGGNGTGNCYLNYGFEPQDVYEGGANEENMSPFARTCDAGGAASGGTLTNFAWCGATLGACTAGTNGATTGTTFQIWSGNAELSAANIATQFAAMINTGGNGLSNLITASPGGTIGAVTLTAKLCGLQGDYSLVNNNLSGFAWSPASAMSGGACSITWTDQGVGNGQTALVEAGGSSAIEGYNVGLPLWQAHRAYELGALLEDAFGDVQQATTAGLSGASTPAWNEMLGGSTTDGTVTWKNVGFISTIFLGSGTNAYNYTQPALK